jgi:predicted regulator of Ras-like GTPase activity (Roadblock/LC7/MglB family)
MTAKNKNSNEPVSGMVLQEMLEGILGGVNERGDFRASLLCTLEGLSIASITSEFDNNKISVISSFVQELSKKAEESIGFKRMGEVSLLDDEGFRLVCREFNVKKQKFILTVVVPPNKPYRHLTNLAIRDLSNALESSMM